MISAAASTPSPSSDDSNSGGSSSSSGGMRFNPFKRTSKKEVRAFKVLDRLLVMISSLLVAWQRLQIGESPPSRGNRMTLL